MSLSTTRLLLREFADHDFAALRAIDGDPEVQHYRGAQTITAEQTRAFIELTKVEPAASRRALARAVGRVSRVALAKYPFTMG